ncbi:dual specificity protein phosphatase family protein [Natrialbaceae archaeon A-CW1-1]
MEQINDCLYIGGLREAGRPSTYSDNDITAVLNLCSLDPVRAYPEYLIIARQPLIDGEQNKLDDFELAVEQLFELLNREEQVFVHCGAGVSRSCAVTATALAYEYGTCIDDAVERIAQKKPDVNPHPTLLEQARQTCSRMSE